MSIAVITGITGQDGAYLTELLLAKGYTVYGTFRRTSSVNFWRIDELGIRNHPHLHLVEYDLTDLSSSIRLLQTTGATEVYNLAGRCCINPFRNELPQPPDVVMPRPPSGAYPAQ